MCIKHLVYSISIENVRKQKKNKKKTLIRIDAERRRLRRFAHQIIVTLFYLSFWVINSHFFFLPSFAFELLIIFYSILVQYFFFFFFYFGSHNSLKFVFLSFCESSSFIYALHSHLRIIILGQNCQNRKRFFFCGHDLHLRTFYYF